MQQHKAGSATLTAQRQEATLREVRMLFQDYSLNLQFGVMSELINAFIENSHRKNIDPENIQATVEDAMAIMYRLMDINEIAYSSNPKNVGHE